MKDKIEFDVKLFAPEDYPNSAAIVFPYKAVDIFGTKGRIPVKFTVGEHTFRSSLAPMGGCHMMVFNLEMRTKTGFKAGDTIHISMEKDTEPRTVDIPEDVTNDISTDENAFHTFMKYSYSHKKEVMDWINDAKKPETRQKRIQKLLDTLIDK